MPDALTDAELVRKTLENADNYGLIIDRFEQPLLRYIGRITGLSHEEIEEIGQIVFIKAYRSLNGFDTRLKLGSWLYRVAHNACVDYLRRSSKKNHTSLDSDEGDNQALIEKIASDENVALHVTRDAEKEGVQAIVHMLPEKYRTVMVLYFLEEKSYEEISDILQIPVNTVWTLLNRAKKHFLALTHEPQFSHLFTYV